MLYRRILYYLEYVFGQVRKAMEENRMQPTPTAKKRRSFHFVSAPLHLRLMFNLINDIYSPTLFIAGLQDCNTLYHRCYIRLCQLWRLSRRDDLLEPVGRYLSRITANRLIFNYALDQCFAAEMDDYIGELGLVSISTNSWGNLRKPIKSQVNLLASNPPTLAKLEITFELPTFIMNETIRLVLITVHFSGTSSCRSIEKIRHYVYSFFPRCSDNRI